MLVTSTAMPGIRGERAACLRRNKRRGARKLPFPLRPALGGRLSNWQVVVSLAPEPEQVWLRALLAAWRPVLQPAA